jgi:hypothetical protein
MTNYEIRMTKQEREAWHLFRHSIIRHSIIVSLFEISLFVTSKALFVIW